MKKFLIILVAVISAALVILFFPKNEIINPNASNSDPPLEQNQEFNTNQNNQLQDSTTNQNPASNPGPTITSAGGSSSSGGGGGSEGGSSRTGDSSETNPLGCEETQVSYAIKDFEKNSSCIIFYNSVCIEKTSTCSLKVTNLDDNITGNFTINFRHYEQGNPPNVVQTESRTFSLAPDQEETFVSTATIQSEDEDGNANKSITCTFQSENIPTKIVCAQKNN